jgi:hypothetical protein
MSNEQESMKTSKIKAKLKVTLFPDSAGKSKLWVAQCLDYDLVAQGETIEKAQQSFIRVLKGHVHLSLLNGEVPFDCIDTKPTKIGGIGKRSKISPSRILEGVQVAFGKMDRLKTVQAV